MTNKGEARLSFRLSAHKKDIIQRAALIKGVTLTKFIIDSALLEANKIIANQENKEPNQYAMGDIAQCFIEAFLEASISETCKILKERAPTKKD